jgi:hypothetical protein
MRYLCLVYHDAMTFPDDARDGEDDHLTRLGPAAAVRIRDGLPTISDGPFVEPPEPLRGYVLIDARDLNEAIRIAVGLPQARQGGVEVWPVQEVRDTPMPAAEDRPLNC